MAKKQDLYTFFYIVRDFLIVYVIGVYYLLWELLQPHNEAPAVKKKAGQIAIVTGGARGIGLEVVRHLLTEGMHVIIASSNTLVGQEQIKKLELEFPAAKVEFKQLDLKSLTSIRNFTTEFLARNIPLHLLVNNAGVMFGPYATTEDGFESQLGINYIGHFYLTYLLLPRLRQTGTSSQRTRIVNVSSCGHYSGQIRISDLNSSDYYSCYGSYGQSKLAQVMFTILLQKYLELHDAPVTVNVVHPGVVNTELYQNTVWNFLPLITKMLFKSPKQGADGVSYVALADELEGRGGKYYENCIERIPSKRSEDKTMQVHLWQETCKMIGIPSSDFRPPLD